MPADLAAEFEAPPQVAAAPSVDLSAEFDPPPRQEQHAVINDAADKAMKWKQADASGRLEILLGGFGDHFTEETKKTLTKNWDDANNPMTELPLAPDSPDVSGNAAVPYNPSILAGAYNGVAPIVSSLTSPLNLATLGTFGALSKVAQGIGPAARAAQTGLGLVKAAFAAQMAKGAGESAGKASVSVGSDASAQEQTTDIVSTLAQSALAALAGHSATEIESVRRGPTEELPLKQNDQTIPQSVPDEPARATAEVPAREPQQPAPDVPAGEAVAETAVGRPPVVEQSTEATATDRRQYDMLQERMSSLLKSGGADAVGSQEYQSAWKASEDIKNKHGGMPPEAADLSKEFDVPEPQSEEAKVITEELAKQPEPPAASETPTTPPEDGSTGIRNAIVDEERKARGLPPAMEEAARGFGEVWNEAMKRLNEDPEASVKLANELNESPRAITDTEDALLTHRQVDLQNQFDKLSDSVVNGAEGQTPESLAADKIRLAKLSDDLLDVYNADKAGGRETARGLNARKMLVNEDLSLAKMVTTRRAANDGRPLTPEQAAEVQALHEKIATTQKEFDEYREKAEASMKAERGTRAIRKVVVTYIGERANEARARIKARMAEGRAQAGFDPSDLADHAIVGADYIARGVDKFADWSENMVKEFGELIRPHLKVIFEKSVNEVDGVMSERVLQAKKTRLEARIKELTSKVDEGDTSTKPAKSSRPSIQEIEKLEQQRDSLNNELTRMREVEVKVKELEAAVSEKERKISEGDLSTNGQPVSRPSVEVIETLKQERDALNDQLADARREANKPTDAEVQKRKLEAMNERIEEKKAALKSGNVAPERKALNRPMSPELEQAKQQLEALNKQIAGARPDPEPIIGEEKLTEEQKRLKSFKTRATNRAEDYRERVATNELGPRSKPEPVKLDEEAIRLRAKAERAKQEFQTAVIKDRLNNRGSIEKAQDTLVRWRRGFLLSGPVTLAKLTGAAILRVVTTPLEEISGAAIGKVLPGVFERAPRHGGFNSRAEAEAITSVFTKGIADAAQKLKTAKSDLDVLFGRGANVRESDVIPQSLIDLFGNLHGALKAPVMRSEFERSMVKRMEFALKEGVDVSDPLVQTKIAAAAYKDSQRAIFMQDNVLSKAFNTAVASLENVKVNGERSSAGKAVATGMRLLLPIVKVPTNIVAEAAEYAVGSITGSIETAKAYRSGIEKLTPEQADKIARQLKKGSLGAAALLIGYYNRNNFGGFYQQGEKRRKDDIKPGEAIIGGQKIGRSLIHSSLMETIQLGATIGRIEDSKVKGKNPEIHEAIGEATLGLLEELPFVRTPIELGKLFDKKERAYTEGELVKGLVVPQALSQTATLLDRDPQGNPISRKPKTILEHVETGIPGLREDVRRK